MDCNGVQGVTHLCVDDFVSAQRARLAEAFPTHFTHERSGARVHRHVAGEVIVRVKHLRTGTNTQ